MGMTEIGLHTMAQRIEGPADDLFHRHGLRQVWVKDGKVGKYTPHGALHFFLFVGNHGSVVLF